MTEGSARNSNTPDLREQEVADYLTTHPDFFANREYLLTDLSLPHPDTGQAVSLLERQVGLLREQKLDLNRKLQHIARAARSNEELLERMEQLILDIIDTPDLETALEILDSAMRKDFRADEVSIRLFSRERGDALFISPDAQELAPFDGLLSRRRPVCGDLNRAQKDFLFGQRAGDMASGAILPLCAGRKSDCIGLLAIGSTDPERFHPEMGTAFLAHLGAVAAKVVRNRLNRSQDGSPEPGRAR